MRSFSLDNNYSSLKAKQYGEDNDLESGEDEIDEDYE